MKTTEKLFFFARLIPFSALSVYKKLLKSKVIFVNRTEFLALKCDYFGTLGNCRNSSPFITREKNLEHHFYKMHSSFQDLLCLSFDHSIKSDRSPLGSSR